INDVRAGMPAGRWRSTRAPTKGRGNPAILENRPVTRRIPPLRLAFRSLLFFVAVAGGIRVVGGATQTVRAAHGFPVYATVDTDDAVALRSHPSGHKTVTTVAPGTELEVLSGPDADGWYKVDPVDPPEAKRGWIRGDKIAINQFVRAAWDLNLMSGPSDSEAVTVWVRHGIVLCVVGPGHGDFLLVRYGVVVGY